MVLRRNILLVLTIGMVWVSSALGQVNFDSKLLQIQKKLDELAVSEVPGLQTKANFSVSGMPLQSFMRAVAETHNLNIQVAQNINATVTNNFTNVVVKDLIVFVCREYTLDVRFTNTIMSFYEYKPIQKLPPPKKPKLINVNYSLTNNKLSMDLKNDSLDLVVKTITAKSGKNVIASSAALEGKKVSGYIKNMPFDDAIDKFAYINGLELRKTDDGFYILEATLLENGTGGNKTSRRSSTGKKQGNKPFFDGTVGKITQVNDTLLSVEAVDAPIIDLLGMASEKMNKDYFIFSAVEGNATVKANNITYDGLLDFLMQTTDYTYKKQEDVYLIGQRSQEGLRSTQLVKLAYRSVEDIEKEIPSELSKGVQVKVFKELNALILSGSTPMINEISEFLKLLDQPVPNIMIEVIVVDLKKGFSIQTGINAFLSDSVPQNTSGRIFPGLDLTVSSQSINNVLDELDSRGIANLGKVTPRFYATLQALEENNNIDVRSTPKLSTLNAHEANLVIGESVYFVEQTQNITPGVNPITTTSQRFSRVEANLSITIKPVVSGNEHITLDLNAEFSDFIAPEIQGAPPGNATRKFDSKIRVRNEEMIMLGGLEQVSKSETGSGLPLLSRIPILKWLFSSKSKQNNQDKLIIFVKPTVVY